MPAAPLRPCPVPGCMELVKQGRCIHHRRTPADQLRGNTTQRGYGWRWQRYRDWFVRQVDCPNCGRNHALCENLDCQRTGHVALAYAVDHITPHRGNTALFWDHANHQSLCQSCHNSKANRERRTTMAEEHI
jgi:5-methylcytosine-specific restriction enzyme A